MNAQEHTFQYVTGVNKRSQQRGSLKDEVYMRLLNRLNQYQRLWQPSNGEPQSVTVGELAERCFCSERHVRTLLKQAQDAG
ncbi:ABC transporter periplasmic-binding protein [Citrobacter freundii]|nr:ABC transporter periplasmic-binding protein [Citrobacter freundii]